MNERASSNQPVAGWARLVRDRRRELDLRQEDLAALAGVSTRFVHALEASKATAQLDKLVAVLTVLGLELRIVGPAHAEVVTL